MVDRPKNRFKTQSNSAYYPWAKHHGFISSKTPLRYVRFFRSGNLVFLSSLNRTGKITKAVFWAPESTRNGKSFGRTAKEAGALRIENLFPRGEKLITARCCCIVHRYFADSGCVGLKGCWIPFMKILMYFEQQRVAQRRQHFQNTVVI